ncbi:zinc finger protein 654-like isoform X3 [Oncorhynchus keta]|uniref:zinc finger protein 654-like isoform X3 n=1 Tax=Oncorhynchus keta TaxID=8018 RepID=UPI00227A6B6E|nr:zinc finger protein 654-like isoform X3 [Oncorhynchus keta]
MAEGESDLETDRLELELETLYIYSNDNCSVQSKEYCSEFCKLVEVHTGRWQVPLPQLKVLRTALTCFTRATVTYPDDCQHVNYALSSLALSFFELMLFFGKEEFLEAPLRDILASFQACHRRLLRHRNVYLLQVRQIIKDGGPWERPALQSILKDTALTQTEVEKYLSSEKPMFFELRVRYLQACERVQEAMALAKCCLEHPDVWRHLFFHQAYLTCLCKASLHQHLHEEMAEIDGRDAVEIICNAESQEKDELLLSLCKAFLSQRLHNGDMYYIWDLVFLWSRLYLRAHPSKQGFLSECRQLMLSAINASAIFPFIKVITAEMGSEGVPLCVELCATALQTDLQSDPVTRCLLCKTIAFLLPRDLEVCRLCALLVFCLERSMEAYKTMYLLYTYPDEEPHPQHTHVRTNIRFYILQVLKEGLFFDPEFWNLLTLRTHCLELMTDKATKDALNELKEEEELEQVEEEWIPSYWMEEETCRIHTDASHLHPHTNTALESSDTVGQEPEEVLNGDAPESQTEDFPVRRRRRKRRWRRRKCRSDIEYADDPDIKYSLIHNLSSESSTKLPANRQREYLARHVKNKILKRRSRKPRWLLLEMTRQTENISPGVMREKRREGMRGEDKRQGGEGKERGHEKENKREMRQGRESKRPYRRTISGMELSFPENEVPVDREVVESHLEPSVRIKQQHNVSEKYVNMGLPNGVYGERPFKYKPESDVDTSAVETSAVETSAVETSAVETSAVETSEVETSAVETSAVETSAVETSAVETSAVETSAVETSAVETSAVETSAVETSAVETSAVETSAVETLKVEPLEVEPSEVDPSDAKPLDSKRSVVEPSDIEPLEVEPLEVEPSDVKVLEGPSEQTDPELDGPALEMEECPLKLFHIYAKLSKGTAAKELLSRESEFTVTEAGPDSNTQGEQTKPGKAPVRSKHLRFHCSHCQKLFKGGNVVRHTLAHLKLRKTRLSCVFCGKHFQRYNRAREHVLEHIEELRTSTANIKVKPTVNGETYPSKNINQASENEAKPVENVTEPSTSTDQPPKPKRVKAKPVVSKQSRIIQNLRNLIRKTQNQKCKMDMDNLKSVEVTDEQVTVKDKVVIVREVVPGKETEGGEDKESEGGEEERKQKQYHLCPSEGCDSIFMKIGPSLLRHAVTYHMEDAAVLDKTFQWGKGKCQICQRLLLVIEHYRDHMKLHDAPLKHACLHTNCDQRFKTAQELKDHIDTHRPLQAPCGYSGCREIFFTLPSLHDHEWRHYTQPQSKDELEQGATTELSPEGEAPWKQRVKSQDVTVHGWRGQRETPTPKSRRSDPHEKCLHCNRYLWNHQHFLEHMKIHDAPLKQVCLHLNCGQRFYRTHLLWEHMDTHLPLQAPCGYSGCGLIFSRLPSLHDHEWRHYIQGQPNDEPTEEQSASKEEGQTPESDTNGNDYDGPMETPGTVHGAVTTPPNHCTLKLINGHDEKDKKDKAPETAVPATTTTSPTPPSQTTTSTHPHPRILQNITEPMTMRDVDNIVSLAQVVPGGEEPVIAEHKTFKQEDPSYLPLAKAPLIRPPPSTYLTEAALSMRKRRKPSEVTSCGPGKKSKAAVKRSVVGKKEMVAEKEAPQRQRCSKCFSSFTSTEELEKHLSQNTCSSLFSFDSDDDSE